jgi:hypothetical protein
MEHDGVAPVRSLVTGKILEGNDEPAPKRALNPIRLIFVDVYWVIIFLGAPKMSLAVSFELHHAESLAADRAVSLLYRAHWLALGPRT